MENKDGMGGLLGNVSLLTTGGSSMQNQLANDELRLHANYGQSTLNNISEIATQNRGGITMETSTPARPMLNTNVMYGFDLSPVHSYEVPVSTKSGKTVLRSQNEEGNNHALEEDSMKAELILDEFDRGNAAPNFMQAPLIPSPHQSRIGAISELEENTTTMMSQVYSPDRSDKARASTPKCRGQLVKSKPKKASSGDLNRSRTPNSPRKTSKHYSNIKSSGYGMVDLSANKSAKKSKQSFATGKTKKPKSPISTERRPLSRDSCSKLPLPSAGPTQETTFKNEGKTKVLGSKFGKTDTNQSMDIFQDTKENESIQSNIVIGNRSPQHNFPSHQSQDLKIRYKDLEGKYNALEAECGKIKLENSQVTQQNFMLSAKLNHFIEDGEKSEVNQETQGNNVETRERDLKKEIIELERLLKGYQQENQKMYQQIAKTKQLNQENEKVMYNENLRLKTRIAHLQEEIYKNEEIIKDKNQIIKENEMQNRNMQQNELMDTKGNSCKEHGHIIKDLKERLSSVNPKQEELKRLKDSENEIVLLKAQVHKMKKELLAKNHSQKESQLVSDLRRQVLELESIATKYQNKDEVKYLIHGNREEQKLLEERCRKLEARIKDQEKDSGENIKSLQQLYNKMRQEYETHVSKLSDEVDIMKSESKKHKIVHREIKSNLILIESLENDKKILNSEIFNLKRNVETLQTENKNLLLQVKESRSNKENKSPLMKGKAKSKGIERVYHPDYFDNSKEYKFKQDNPLRISVERKNAKELDSINEMLKWKALYEESKLELESSKSKYLEQIVSINEANQKTVQILEERLSTAERKFCESESTKYSIEVEKSTSQVREAALQQEIKYLLDELQETRMGSPDIAFRRIEALQSRVSMMDMRQKAREEKLDQALVKSADSYLKQEIENLHATIAEKNNLLVKFRYELDSMLLTLEKLQRNAI